MTSRRLPALVGFLVLVLGIAVVLAVGAGAGRRNVPARVSVPRVFPGSSHLTADFTRSPLGRAVALYRQGAGVGIAGTPQVLAQGSDGRGTRTVDVALEPGRGDVLGDPAPATLSPDGSLVVVGERRAAPAATDLVEITTATGAERVVRLPAARGVVPVAWSQDSRYLAYVGADTTNVVESAVAGPLFVLDTRSGRSDLLTGDVSAAAFSPDGSRVAVQSPGSTQIRVLDRSGRTVDQLLAPDHTRIAGGAAWSPDGSLLAVFDDVRDHVGFVPVAATAVVPAPVPSGGRVLGWLSPTDLLVPAPLTSVGDGDQRLLRADLVEGDTSVWASVPTAGARHAVRDVTLATALLPRAQLVPGGDVDRGPWPLGLRIGFVVAGAVVSSFSAVGLRRRGEAVRSLVTTPTWSTDSSIG
jgi:WD40 repeat protein